MRSFEACTLQQRDLRARDDLVRLASLCTTANSLSRELVAHTTLWERDDEAPLSPVERVTALRLFDRSFDLQVAAHTITRFHRGVLERDPHDDPARHALHFGLAHRAYFRRLSLGMDLCVRAQNRPQFETLLDEGDPELGLRPGLWASFKGNVLHVEHIARVAAARDHHNDLVRLLEDVDAPPPELAALLEGLDHDWEQLRTRLFRDAPRLLLGNVLDRLRDAGQALLMPVQVEVAGWLGDTRIYRGDDALIASAQAREATARTRPGDVIFERRNWYLSNIGLPGFWPHAAMWVGTADELSAALDDEPSVREAYRGAFTDALRAQFPKAWASFVSLDEGHPRRVIEAVSEGVVFSTAEHTLHADYAAALRPRRSPLDVARALELAFSYWGRPYDFDFDFYSDQSLVCSELVYKCWEPRPGLDGIALPLIARFGRQNLGANDIVAHWDRQADEDDSPFDFVWFLDGREATETALWGTAESLRASHQRSKWDLSQE